ncbi:MAG: hypothetical protein KatS3mg009_1734 [Acidimicrobiia bacterium]|nr:MAG: hypothetical protein KatS3mg009_1734 [Acidimicrobiia bacterium]
MAQGGDPLPAGPGTAAGADPGPLGRDELLALFAQLSSVGSVELKMTVPGEQRMALRELRIDPLRGRIREVVFFDTSELACFHHGVVLRARRTQGAPEDTVVKLRPAVPDELPPAVRDSPNLKVEMDVTRGSYVVSASLKGVRKAGSLHAVLDGARPLDKLFTKEQRALFASHAPAGVSWGDLVPLGPVFVVLAKAVPQGASRRLTIEQWHYPGEVPLVELSTKAAPLDTVRVYEEVAGHLRGLGIEPAGEQEPKTRRALEFFARHVPGRTG